MDDRTKTVLTAIRRILRATELTSKSLLLATGLTPSQLLLLRLLEEDGEMSPGQIAKRMGITQATITGIIHKLEQRELVVRRKGETDRRQVWLSLSEMATTVLAATPDGVHERFEQRFAELTDWEQASLIAALERIAEMLDAHELEAAPIFDAAALENSASDELD